VIWILTGLAVLALLAWAGRTGAPTGRRAWRLLAPAIALVAVVAGVFSLLRGAWPAGLLLVGAGLVMAAVARTAPTRTSAPPPQAAPDDMTLAAARSVLGVGPEASRDEILAAHARLIRRIHPDAGGTDGLAAHLNAARDRLLEG
jgi:hypothetical protein